MTHFLGMEAAAKLYDALQEEYQMHNLYNNLKAFKFERKLPVK